MLNRRSFLSGIAGLSALTCSGVLAGCNGRRASDVPSTVDRPSTWVSCRIAEPYSIDPLFAMRESDLEVCNLIFDPLTSINVETGEVEPLACTSFSCSKDSRSFVFALPEGATFHNGEAVDAASFKRSWERLVAFHILGAQKDGQSASQEGNAHLYASSYGSLLEDVEGYDEVRRGDADELSGVRCIDAHTLEVRLSRPCASFAAIASHPLLGPMSLEMAKSPDSLFPAPVGNGPLCCQTEWDPDGKQLPKSIELSAFSKYLRGGLGIDGSILVVQDDTHAAYKSFQTGDLDICDVPVEQYREAEKAYGLSSDGNSIAPGQRMACVHLPGLVYLDFLPESEAGKSFEVRRAISCAIDREALCEKSLRSSYEQAVAPLSASLAPVKAWQACSYDPEEAAKLLEAKYPEGEDGKRDCPVVLLHRKGGVLGRIATQIADDLLAVGVEVKVVAAEEGDFEERLAKGDVSCVLRAWEPRVPDSLCATDELLKAGGWSLDEEALKLKDELSAELDSAKRAGKASELWASIGKGLPFAPLVHPVRCKVASERVASLDFDMMGRVDLARAELV